MPTSSSKTQTASSTARPTKIVQHAARNMHVAVVASAQSNPRLGGPMKIRASGYGQAEFRRNPSIAFYVFGIVIGMIHLNPVEPGSAQIPNQLLFTQMIDNA